MKSDDNLEKVDFEINSVGSFGATITGLDLKNPLNENVIRKLRHALHQFQILIFSDQTISPADQTRITHYFGSLEPSIARRPPSHHVSGHPNILYLNNIPGSPTMEYGFSWHSDGLAYAKVPHGVTMLYCLESPPGAGDTLFANQYDAYQIMSKGFRKLLRDLYWHLPNMPHSEIPMGKGLVQPMVRIHSITEREFLFCAPNACQIRGMTKYESEGILRVVHEYQVREELVYRHKWQKKDVVLWENCALLHNRADEVNYKTQGLRAMHRSATSENFSAIECEAPED